MADRALHQRSSISNQPVMAATLKLEIVTPEAKTYSEDVEMVTLPGVEGEMGIYPMHVPLMTQIVAGELSVRKGGQDYFLAVGEGFVEITADKVAIMTDMAIRAEQIDEVKAEEARKRADCIRTRCAPGRRALRTPAGSGVQCAFKVRDALSLGERAGVRAGHPSHSIYPSFVPASSNGRTTTTQRTGNCCPRNVR